MNTIPPEFAPHEFRKSSFSGENGNNCVEVAHRTGWAGVRDSKQRGHGPILAFTLREWATFTESVKAGALDR